MAEERDLGAVAREIIDANPRFADPEAHNLRHLPTESMRQPAAHRLYRATATGHFVLDPAGHPDGSAATIALPSTSSPYSTVSSPSMPCAAWSPMAQ